MVESGGVGTTQNILPCSPLLLIAMLKNKHTSVKLIDDSIEVTLSMAELDALKNQLAETQARLRELEFERDRLREALAGRDSVGALAQVQAHMGTLLASMAEGVLAISNKGLITTVNPAAEQMLGLERGLAEGQPAARVLPFPLDNFYPSYRVQLQDRVLSVLCSEMRGEQGGKVLLLRDITEEARIEKLKEDFLVLVSHELRTPVTAITGSLEVLVDPETGPLNEIQKGFMDVALTNTERLSQILNDVIDILAIQSEKMSLDSCQVLLVDALARATSGKLDELAQQKHLHVRVNLTEAPLVFGDARRIVQILSNLVTNAYKYTPPGGLVTITSKAEGEDMVRVSIADTGIGLTPTARDHLGETFYRVDNSLIREVGGTGLGLAITKALAELHGGYLEVSSTPGRGSIFSILLPANGLAARQSPLFS